MKLTKPILIILALGAVCGYFFTLGAYPVGLLCAPVCLVFFRFSKEKLSAHTNLFALIATICGIIIYHTAFIGNIKKIILWFFAILILNILGKIFKKKLPAFMQIVSLIFWGLLILAFLVLSTVHMEPGHNTAKFIKLISLFFCGTLGLPPAPLFIPCVSMFNESVSTNCLILMVSALPAIILNLCKEFKKENIDFKFSAYYIIALVFGILLACVVLSAFTYGEWAETLYQISIIIPSIVLFCINIYNTYKSLKKIRNSKK